VNARIVVLVPWLVFVVFWGLSARNVKKTKIRLTPQWRWFAARIVVIALLLVCWRSGAFRTSPLPRNSATDVVGIALCVIGVSFAIWARWHLGTNWSATPSLKEEHELVTTGPYHFVRHPIYTGALLASLGTAMVVGSPGWIVFALLCVTFVYRVGAEEQLMEAAFPNDYRSYRQRTKALIPLLW